MWMVTLFGPHIAGFIRSSKGHGYEGVHSNVAFEARDGQHWGSPSPTMSHAKFHVMTVAFQNITEGDEVLARYYPQHGPMTSRVG